MYELLKKNGLRMIVEPDIYAVAGEVGCFLEDNNLCIQVTASPSTMLGGNLMAEYSMRHCYIDDPNTGVRIKNGMKTNTQHYITPDITAHPFDKNDAYDGERIVGVGKDIHEAIAGLFRETKNKFLIIENMTGQYSFVQVPSIDFRVGL